MFDSVYLKLLDLFRFKSFNLKLKYDSKDYITVLGWNVSSGDILNSAGNICVILFINLVLLLVLSFIFNFYSIFLLVLLFIPLLVFYVVIKYPEFRARGIVSSSISSSSLIVLQLVSYLKVNPNLEWALRESVFCDDWLSKELYKILRYSRIKGGIENNLLGFAQFLGLFSAPLKLVFFQIISALRESDFSRRLFALDNCIAVFLSDVKRNAFSFSDKVVSVVFIIFCAGVVVPLILLSLFPFLNIFSTLLSLVFIFLVLLVICLSIYFLTDYLLLYKSFNVHSYSFRVSFDFKLFLLCLLLFFVISFPFTLFLLERFGFVNFKFFSPFEVLFFVVSLFFSSAVFLFFSVKDLIKSVNINKKLELDLSDTLFFIARDVGSGKPLESALLNCSKLMDNSFSSFFKDVFRLVGNQRISLFDAFFNSKYGVFRCVYSNVVSQSFSFIAKSSSVDSSILSSVLFSLSGHIRDLFSVEDDFLHHLSQCLGAVGSTVSFFAPVICALVVVISSLISSSLLDLSSSLNEFSFGFNFPLNSVVDSSFLQLLSGVYLFLLVIVLTRFSVFLKFNSNKPLLYFELSKVFITAIVIYSVVFLISKKLFGVLL